MDMLKLYANGRTTKDSQLLESKESKKYATFSLATNRRIADGSYTPTFVDCICFGKLAEKLAEKVKKGDRVNVTGRPEVSAYINKHNEPRRKSQTNRRQLGSHEIAHIGTGLRPVPTFGNYFQRLNLVVSFLSCSLLPNMPIPRYSISSSVLPPTISLISLSFDVSIISLMKP